MIYGKLTLYLKRMTTTHTVVRRMPTPTATMMNTAASESSEVGDTSGSPVKCRWVVTARKRSLRRLSFYRCLSVHEGACVAGDVHGTGACMAGGMHGTPPDRYYEIRSMSGRYASYWNAFLLQDGNWFQIPNDCSISYFIFDLQVWMSFNVIS